MFASKSILALLIPTYSYLGSCFEWWRFGFQPKPCICVFNAGVFTANSPITYLGFCPGEDWGCPGWHALQRRTSQSKGLALGHSKVFQLQSPMCPPPTPLRNSMNLVYFSCFNVSLVWVEYPGVSLSPPTGSRGFQGVSTGWKSRGDLQSTSGLRLQLFLSRSSAPSIGNPLLFMEIFLFWHCKQRFFRMF